MKKFKTVAPELGRTGPLCAWGALRYCGAAFRKGLHMAF